MSGIPIRKIRPVILYDRNALPFPVVKDVGILPFMRTSTGAGYQVMVMMPKHDENKFPNDPPQFQIAKGGRQLKENGAWRDMSKSDLEHKSKASLYEPLLDAALREGAEEIGLKTSNIKIDRCFDMGVFHYQSQSNKNTKIPMHIFAVEINDPLDFNKKDLDPKTGAVCWMDGAKFSREAREDHKEIVGQIIKRLRVREVLPKKGSLDRPVERGR